jgi:hypothetical protein
MTGDFDVRRRDDADYRRAKAMQTAPAATQWDASTKNGRKDVAWQLFFCGEGR